MKNRLLKVTRSGNGKLSVTITTEDASERHLLQLLLPEYQWLQHEWKTIFAPNLARPIFEQLVDEQDLPKALEGFFRVGLTAFAELMRRELANPDFDLEAIKAIEESRKHLDEERGSGTYDQKLRDLLIAGESFPQAVAWLSDYDLNFATIENTIDNYYDQHYPLDSGAGVNMHGLSISNEDISF